MRQFVCSMDVIDALHNTIMFDTGSSTSWSQILMYGDTATVRWLLNQRWLRITQHGGVLRPHLEYFDKWASAEQLPENVTAFIMDADAVIAGFAVPQTQIIPHCENHQVTSTEPSGSVSAMEGRIVVSKIALK